MPTAGVWSAGGRPRQSVGSRIAEIRDRDREGRGVRGDGDGSERLENILTLATQAHFLRQRPGLRLGIKGGEGVSCREALPSCAAVEGTRRRRSLRQADWGKGWGAPPRPRPPRDPRLLEAGATRPKLESPPACNSDEKNPRRPRGTFPCGGRTQFSPPRLSGPPRAPAPPFWRALKLQRGNLAGTGRDPDWGQKSPNRGSNGGRDAGLGT